MAERLPTVVRDGLTSKEQSTFDKLDNQIQHLFGPPEKSPFVIKRKSDGGLMGPCPILFAAPDAGEYVMGIYPTIAKISGLPADAKEVAILTVGARYQAAYELYAHSNVAQKNAGMAKDVVDAICRGKKPDGLNEACSVAYDATEFLVGTPGPLPQQLWDRCIAALGKEGTVALVHYVGAYAYTCILLNAMDAPVPKEGD